MAFSRANPLDYPGVSSLLLPSRPRWGRLQRQARRAFIALDAEALRVGRMVLGAAAAAGAAAD
jgi:hypothetical protein